MPDTAWKDPSVAGRRDRPAQVALTTGVFASMGTLCSFAAFVGAQTDLRFNPLFWLGALPSLVWIGALGQSARWATRTFRFVVLLWPVLSLWGYVEARQMAAAGRTPHLATPRAELIVLAITASLSLVSWVAVRQSSMPGGNRTFDDLPLQTATPLAPTDGELISINWRVGACLFAWIFACIVFFVGSAILNPDAINHIGRDMLVYMAGTVAIVVLMMQGALQARRTPARVPPPYLWLLSLQVGWVAILIADLAWLARGKSMPGTLGFLAVDLLVLLLLASSALSRISRRAKQYAGKHG